MDGRTLSHDDLADDVPAYVFGTLDLDQCERLEAHLAICAICQAEQRRLAAALGVLGTLAPPANPPVHLRSSLLARLSEPAEPAEPLAADPAASASAPHALRLATPRWVRFALAAAAALIVALGAWVAVIMRDLDQTQDVLAAVRRTSDQAAALLAEQPRTIPMIASESLDAHGTLYLSTEHNRALLAVSKLPPSPPGRVYQVWLVQGQNRASAGVFTTDSDGASQLVIESPQPLLSYDALGITEEPGPHGSPGPTSPRIIGCPLP